MLEVSIHELAFGATDPYEPKSEEISKELFTGDVRVTKLSRRIPMNGITYAVLTDLFNKRIDSEKFIFLNK
jgi:hypothetical protein